MLKPIIVVGICIFALMLAIKDGRVLRVAGLTGSCKVVQTLSDSSQLDICHSGKLEGRPDLSHRACTSIEIVGKNEYWHCPANLAANDAGR
jgi:hypothetical protein